MKKFSILLFTYVCIISCSQEEADRVCCGPNRCAIPATIRDYTGVDGCSFVLQLNDGTILEPLRMVMCGPPPEPIMTLDDPLLAFQEDGKRVLIDYELKEGPSVCMTGRLAKITCIKEELSTSAE